ncbi:MAG TPA: hypothetical protein VMB03_25350 [Bryobacteraceae bacterium]|nr:hypothetical protein [Bryobacteraceae bacterium]
MKKSLTLPTSELVKTACDEFDRENAEVEGALTELFRQYPENTDARHVLLKVAALNALYSTQIRVYTKTIPNVLDVARHISRNGAYIDSALAAGALEVVDFIARMTVPGKKNHINSRSQRSIATGIVRRLTPSAMPASMRTSPA